MYEALSRMSGFECKQGVRDRRPRPSLARRAPRAVNYGAMLLRCPLRTHDERTTHAAGTPRHA